VEAIDFRILGPLELRAGGRALPLGGKKQTALLALLLLHPNEVVSSDRLIDELWPDAPSDAAEGRLHVAVSRLRKQLRDSGETLLVRKGHGYGLMIDPQRVTPAASSTSRTQAGPRSPTTATPVGRASCSLTRFVCGEVPPWPTSPTNRSPRSRSAGSRTCESTP